MKVVADFDNGVIMVTMYSNGHQAVCNMDPMSAKLIGELMIANANKLMEYKRRKEENER